MSDYNRVTLVGHVSTKPIMKKYKTKPSVTRFSMVVERFAGRNLETIKDTFTIVATGKLGEVINNWADVGRKILLDGHIQIRTETRKETRKWITEIVAENIKFLSKETQDAA